MTEDATADGNASAMMGEGLELHYLGDTQGSGLRRYSLRFRMRSHNEDAATKYIMY